MHPLELTKPDGRRLTLYAREPIAAGPAGAEPVSRPAATAAPHLRWHPLRGEWVTYAAYRQGRTFLPPPEYNPLAVTRDPANPTELPAGRLGHRRVRQPLSRRSAQATGATAPPSLIVPTAPASGQCEVVVFTQDPTTSLGALPLAHIELLLRGAGATARSGSARATTIQYVLPFENRGAEVGVTLHHPHGQIYAYPVVPPVPARMQQAGARTLHAQRGAACCRRLIADERRDGRADPVPGRPCGRLRAGVRALPVRGVGARRSRRCRASRS